MKLEEFKDKFKLTKEEEIECQIQKEKNLKSKIFYNSARKHAFLSSFLILLTINLIPFYFSVPLFIVLLSTGLVFDNKYKFYDMVVRINNMSMEDHYKFFEDVE
jgi:hypothetical protein